LTWIPGRPAKWTCERTEAFVSDYQGRDLIVEAELALDNEGNFLAVRGSNLSNLGGHAAAFVSLQKGLGLMSSVYHIPVGHFRDRGAVTNTVSTSPYRSAGRPEAIFVIERLIDLAADQLGLIRDVSGQRHVAQEIPPRFPQRHSGISAQHRRS
jgi:carbon-monoxide dehydrogenase large subunit